MALTPKNARDQQGSHVDTIRGIRKASSVTPSNTDHLVDPSGNNLPTRAVWVGVAGNLEVVFADSDNVVTINGVTAGHWHPMELRQIRTASTATQIIAGW